MTREGPGDALRNGSCQILDIGTGFLESVGLEPNSERRGIDSVCHFGHILSLFFLVFIQFQDSLCPPWMFNMLEWVR